MKNKTDKLENWRKIAVLIEKERAEGKQYAKFNDPTKLGL